MMADEGQEVQGQGQHAPPPQPEPPALHALQGEQALHEQAQHEPQPGDGGLATQQQGQGQGEAAPAPAADPSCGEDAQLAYAALRVKEAQVLQLHSQLQHWRSWSLGVQLQCAMHAPLALKNAKRLCELAVHPRLPACLGTRLTWRSLLMHVLGTAVRPCCCVHCRTSAQPCSAVLCACADVGNLPDGATEVCVARRARGMQHCMHLHWSVRVLGAPRSQVHAPSA